MIVYEGPSMLNGEPIVAILTGLDGGSKNDKTGKMAQLWILPQEIPPHIAVQLGLDDSVCGDCPARGKWCYVTVFQAPFQVFKHYWSGGYPPFRHEAVVGADIRLGAYGDPAALPLETLYQLTKDCEMFTGYTHQWRSVDREYSLYCMASCDSLQDYWDAKELGYRTFRVTESLSTQQPNESVCPASDEAGNLLQCIDCGACDGRRRPRVKGDIVIKIHGSKRSTYDAEVIQSPGSRQPGRKLRDRSRQQVRGGGQGRSGVLRGTRGALVGRSSNRRGRSR